MAANGENYMAAVSVRLRQTPGAPSEPYPRDIVDLSSDFGARAARHLREETVVWLTTVTPKGAPLPSPVWFLWDGEESVLMYSMPSARITNLKGNPRGQDAGGSAELPTLNCGDSAHRLELCSGPGWKLPMEVTD